MAPTRSAAAAAASNNFAKSGDFPSEILPSSGSRASSQADETHAMMDVITSSLIHDAKPPVFADVDFTSSLNSNQPQQNSQQLGITSQDAAGTSQTFISPTFEVIMPQQTMPSAKTPQIPSRFPLRERQWAETPSNAPFRCFELSGTSAKLSGDLPSTIEGPSLFPMETMHPETPKMPMSTDTTTASSRPEVTYQFDDFGFRTVSGPIKEPEQQTMVFEDPDHSTKVIDQDTETSVGVVDLSVDPKADDLLAEEVTADGDLSTEHTMHDKVSFSNYEASQMVDFDELEVSHKKVKSSAPKTPMKVASLAAVTTKSTTEPRRPLSLARAQKLKLDSNSSPIRDATKNPAKTPAISDFSRFMRQRGGPTPKMFTRELPLIIGFD